MLVAFSFQDKLEKVWFLEETFILPNTNVKVVIRIPFDFFSDVNMRVTEKELI